MKKLFISVPMKGRTDEAIKNSIEKMHKIAELKFGEELDVIDTFCVIPEPDGANRSIYCLGHSIQKLAEADYFIGIDYSEFYSGCHIEHEVARHYNIKMTHVEMHECEFLADAHELEKACWANSCTCTPTTQLL